jgi:hypothetical protein
MKKVTYKILIFSAFLIAAHIKIFAGKEEFSKTIQKEFQINSSSSLEINNKYGDIHIQNWDQNSFKIVVKITVDVKDNSRAEELMDLLKVDFTQDGNRIIANTKISDEFGNAKGWFGNSGKKFSIDYTINMPKSNSLKLNNKYGNIFINEMNGLVDVDLKYGDITINKLTRGDEKPMNQIILAYAKANIIECNWLKLQLSYSKIDMDKNKALILVSKYSKGSIGKSSSIVGDNSYDNYQIGDLSNLVVEGKYSNFQINSVAKKIDVNIKFTDIKVNTIPKTFETIEVDNQYGKINLGIESGASYHLDGVAKFANIEYPNENARLNRISENTQMSVNGTIGSSSKSSVRVNTQYGGVKLFQ